MKIDEQRSTESPTESPDMFRPDGSSLAVPVMLAIMAGGGDRLASGQATEPATEGTLDGEELNRDWPFNNLGQALIYGGVRIIDGLIDIPDAVGTPRR